MSKLFDDASLAMIPSAYKDGKLYSIRPTDGSGDFTFSRGSNLAATRVDVNGLIEKGRENLLLQSNQFDTTWTLASQMLTPVGGQSGYDGTNDAWKIQRSDTSGRFIRQNISQSGVQTFSVYAKKGNVDYISLVSVGSNVTKAIFSLPTDGSGVNTYLDSDNISAKISYISNGWYRVEAVYSDTITDVRIYPSETATAEAGVIADAFVYIQDAQLEAGLVATDYIETGASTAQAGILEDMPRLDYSGGASCPALLLEPQRTNLLTHSEYFGGWNKINQGTGSSPVLSIGGDFPLGDGKYYNLQCNLNGGTTSSDRSYISLGGLSATQFTATKSIWIKNNSASEAVLFIGINFSADKFTLAANADWQRITIDGGVINTEFRIGLGGGFEQSNTIDVSIFGAQCEAGSYPTSYIPTYGSSVTRSKDEMETGTLDNLTSYSLLIDIKNLKDIGGSITFINKKTASSAYGRIFLKNGSDISYFSSSTSYLDNNLSLSDGEQHKYLLRVTNGFIEEFFDGAKQTNTGTNSSDLFSGIELPTSSVQLDLNQLVVFPTALTDSEAIALTTL